MVGPICWRRNRARAALHFDPGRGYDRGCEISRHVVDSLGRGVGPKVSFLLPEVDVVTDNRPANEGFAVHRPIMHATTCAKAAYWDCTKEPGYRDIIYTHEK